MTLADELAYTTLTSLALRIRQRELSPVEVINAFIERISTRNPVVNAFVCKDFERAHDEAVKAEQALTNGDEVGPLHGIPVAIKDLFSSKPGTPMTMGGVRALTDNITQHRCIFTERIEQAGHGVLHGDRRSDFILERRSALFCFIQFSLILLINDLGNRLR